MPATILVVDDKINVRLLLQEHLTQQGYHVLTAENGSNALYTARHHKPDLILLDIMMPEMDGYQFLSLYRREAKTPVIIITAKEEETDAVLGLELGADDYIVKPFRLRELAARIHAVLRRASQADQLPRQTLRVADLLLDRQLHSVRVGEQTVNLTPTEFNLLEIFMAAPEHVFTREALIERLEDSGFSGLERTINVHIRNLRMKIEPDPAHPRYIETVFGIGYRLTEPREEQ
jgi:DNA-binding response OmpR family regulator